MKSLLICPEETLAVRALSRTVPAAAVQILGKPLLVYWIEHLVALGAREIIILASDRPHKIRDIVHDGYPWGIKVEVIAQRTQSTAEEARAAFHSSPDQWLQAPYDVVEVNSLPNSSTKNLFESFETYFTGVRCWIPHAQSNRINIKEISPGVWVSARSSISEKAVIKPPCWIGDNVRVEEGAVIGPMTVLENNTVIGRNALVANSIVEADTYIGELTSVEDSIACGNILINWKTNSLVEIPDSFLISFIGKKGANPHPVGMGSRALALIIAVTTAPLVLPYVLQSFIFGTHIVSKSIAARLSEPGSLTYYQLRDASGYFARWPQLWNIVRGQFAWFGNRPLSPREASEVSPEFERLWLERPPGLFSQADAAACWNNHSDEAVGHACFYAAERSYKTHWAIFRGVCSNWRRAARETRVSHEGRSLRNKLFELRRLVSDFLSL